LVRPVADPKPPPWTRPKPPPQKAQVGFGTGRSINGSSINYNSID
jgi:hypothetical protein